MRKIEISKATIDYHNVYIKTNAFIPNLPFKTYCPVIKIYIYDYSNVLAICFNGHALYF